MINLAICDDQMEFTEKLRKDLLKIFKEIGVDTNIEVYGRGEDLQSDLNGGSNYDLIFLDINLITLNGIDVANFIREKDNGYSTQIVFISSEKRYALKLFDHCCQLNETTKQRIVSPERTSFFLVFF